MCLFVVYCLFVIYFTCQQPVCVCVRVRACVCACVRVWFALSVPVNTVENCITGSRIAQWLECQTCD